MMHLRPIGMAIVIIGGIWIALGLIYGVDTRDVLQQCGAGLALGAIGVTIQGLGAYLENR